MHERDRRKQRNTEAEEAAVSGLRRSEESEAGPGIHAPVTVSCLADHSATV